MLLAQCAVVGCHALAVMRVGAGLVLVDQVTYCQRVFLRGAEHQRLFALVDHLHQFFDAVFLALPDFDDLVEVRLHVALARLYLALDQRVVGGIDVFVQRGCNLHHFEGR